MSKLYAISRHRLIAISTEDGILISSSKFPGEQQPMCAYAYRDKEGNIQKEYYNQSVIAQNLDWKNEHPKEEKYQKKVTRILMFVISVIFALFAIFGSEWVTASAIALWIIMYWSEALYNVAYFFATALYHKNVAPMLSRYHGAEHMALAAYTRRKRIPTVEEVAGESWFDSDCSSVDNTLKPTLQSVLNSLILTLFIVPGIYGFTYVVTNLHGTWIYSSLFLIVLILLFVLDSVIDAIPKLLDKGFESGFLTHLMQWSVVASPSLSEIEVAIEALKLRDYLDEKIIEHKEEYTCEYVNFSLSDKRAIFTYKNGEKAQVTLKEYVDQINSYRDAKEINEEDKKKCKAGTYIYEINETEEDDEES